MILGCIIQISEWTTLYQLTIHLLHPEYQSTKTIRPTDEVIMMKLWGKYDENAVKTVSKRLARMKGCWNCHATNGPLYRQSPWTTYVAIGRTSVTASCLPRTACIVVSGPPTFSCWTSCTTLQMIKVWMLVSFIIRGEPERAPNTRETGSGVYICV